MRSDVAVLLVCVSLFGAVPGGQVKPPAEGRAREGARSVADAAQPQGAGAERPSARVEVPELVGLSESDARQVIEGRGLELGRVERRPDTRRRGTVVGQEPAAGDLVAPGRRVAVVLVDPQLAEVPDLVARPIEEARRRCDDWGLRLRTVRRTSDTSEGTVLSQRPRPGERVPLGAEVTVAVAVRPAIAESGAARVAVPPEVAAVPTSGIVPAPIAEAGQRRLWLPGLAALAMLAFAAIVAWRLSGRRATGAVTPGGRGPGGTETSGGLVDVEMPRETNAEPLRDLEMAGGRNAAAAETRTRRDGA